MTFKTPFLAIAIAVFAHLSFALNADNLEPINWASDAVKSMVENIDGSVTLEEPYFAKLSSVAQFFSTKSDISGICKMYGFTEAVPGGIVTKVGQFNGAVIVDAAGRFKEFENTLEYMTRIDLLMCKLDLRDAVKSGNAFLGGHQIDEKDGSFRLWAPMFGNSSYVRLASAHSSKNAICRMFGLKSYKPDTVVEEPSQRKSIFIDTFGNFRRLHSDKVITELSCFAK